MLNRNPSVELDRFAALGQMAEARDDQPADRVEFFVGEMRAQGLVEIVDLGAGLDAEHAFAFADDVVLGLVEVVFVLDVANDLLQHVFDRHQSGNAAVLVDDDGDVIAVGTEFLQQHVEPLRFRNEHGGTQHAADVAVGFGVVAQQVLGQQNSNDVVAVLVDDREARVRGFDDVGNEGFGRVVDVDHIHLRARDHDLADAHLGHLQHALDHRQGVGIHQTVFVGAVKQFDQLFTVFGFAHQPVGDALEQARFGGTTVGLHFLRSGSVGIGDMKPLQYSDFA